MTFRFLLAAALLIAARGTASAQDKLHLADVYRHAVTAPRVQAANALAAAARSRISSARRPPDPELQLGLMNRELPSLGPMDPLGMTQIQVMQMIPAPGKLRLAGRAAGETAAASRLRATDVYWDARARAAMAFYDLYAADSQLVIARQTKRLMQDISATSQTMYSLGEARQADVLRAQVEVERMSEEIVRMESMRTAMAGRLSGMLNLPAERAIAPPAFPRLPDSLPPLEQLTREAELTRPMIAAGDREVAASIASERLARKEIWPDLQLGIQYGWRGGEMGTEKMASLMIGAAIPVHARSRQLRMRDEAAAMKEMAIADLASMRAETRGRMTELYADYTKARNLITLYTTTVIPQAEGAVTASFSAYRVGTVDFTTLLDNQAAVNGYRQQLVSLRAEQGKSIAEMEMLLGRQIFEPVPAARSDR